MKEEERVREVDKEQERERARALYAIVHALCREQRAGRVDCLVLSFAFLPLLCASKEDPKFIR